MKKLLLIIFILASSNCLLAMQPQPDCAKELDCLKKVLEDLNLKALRSDKDIENPLLNEFDSYKSEDMNYLYTTFKNYKKNLEEIVEECLFSGVYDEDELRLKQIELNKWLSSLNNKKDIYYKNLKRTYWFESVFYGALSLGSFALVCKGSSLVKIAGYLGLATVIPAFNCARKGYSLNSTQKNNFAYISLWAHSWFVDNFPDNEHD